MKIPRVSLRRATAVVVALVVAGPVGAAPFEPPSPVVRKLDNGLEVAVIVDARLPVVQIQLLVPAGAAQEPAAEAGVAALTAQLLVRGTSSRSRRELATELEKLGGSLGANASREYATVSGAFLARDLEMGLELLADAALHPSFPDEEVEARRRELINALFQSRQNLPAVAEEHLWGLALGDHPVARPSQGALDILPGVRRRQLQAFHRDTYRPDRALLAVAGDVTPEKVFALVESQFGSWSGVARRPAGASVPGRPERTRVRIVDAPTGGRVEIRMGHVGPARATPDYPAALTASQILGGSAMARLNGAVRGGQSGLVFQKDLGLFWMGAPASADSAAIVIERLRAELRRFVSAAPAEAEVAAARELFQGSYALQYDGMAGVVASWMASRWFGIADSPARHAERMAGVTTAEVAAAASRWFDPDHLAIVVVGPAASLRSSLEALGTVEVVPGTGAPVAIQGAPSTLSTAPSAAEVAQGKKLLEQALAAHGGLAKLRGIKDSSVEGEITLVGEGRELAGRLREVRREPRQFWFFTNFVTTEALQVLDGDRAWTRLKGDSIVDEDSLVAGSLRVGFASDLHHLLLAAADPAARVSFRGREPDAGKPADVVEVVPPGDAGRFVLFLDVATHRVVAMEQNEGSAARLNAVRRRYGDYKPVSGIVWPHVEEREVNGERAMTVTLKKVELNTGVGAEFFRRPGAPAPAPDGTWKRSKS